MEGGRGGARGRDGEGVEGDGDWVSDTPTFVWGPHTHVGAGIEWAEEAGPGRVAGDALAAARGLAWGCSDAHSADEGEG